MAYVMGADSAQIRDIENWTFEDNERHPIARASDGKKYYGWPKMMEFLGLTVRLAAPLRTTFSQPAYFDYGPHRPAPPRANPLSSRSP